MNKRIVHTTMLTGGVIGLIAAFLQTIEKIQLLSPSTKSLPCNINSIFNCSAVLESWQSSLFGFPNSLLCIVFFTTFAVVALAVLCGGELPHKLRLGIQGLALFVLLFALWFLAQSIYVIGAICIFCIFCFAGLLMVNWAWLRLNAHHLPVGKRTRQLLAKAIEMNIDTLGWFILAALVAFAIMARFY